MDIYCQICAEPWDICEELTTIDDGGTIKDIKNGGGCPSCNWGKDKPKLEGKDVMRSMAMGAMADVMGDDIDGIASMLDDFDYLGLLD